MAHRRKSLWSDGTAAAAVSSAAGILCSLLLLLLFSALVCFLMDSLMFMDAFSIISLAAGSFAGSFVYGKFRRRGGLIGGILCGAVMYVFLSAAAFAVDGSAMSIKNSFCCAFSVQQEEYSESIQSVREDLGISNCPKCLP